VTGSPEAELILRQIRAALGPRWEFTTDGENLEILHRDRGTPFVPARRQLSWADLLDRLQNAFAEQGVPRAPVLPLRWGRETELTISAIQALDPLLKDGRLGAYRRGFMPQPVVRLTGKRNADGTLRDGFLTSFANTSRIEPVSDGSAYALILDEWLTVLSRLGLHARHIGVHGRLAVWRRRQVEGISLHFHHAQLPIGDIVLLWNASRPECMAVDLGTSLERLAWARTRACWSDLVFGSSATAAPTPVLDALRTATLLLGNGILPASRGAGSTTRRVLAAVPQLIARTGVSAVVRQNHAYWDLFAPLQNPWPEVARMAEVEIAAGPPRHTAQLSALPQLAASSAVEVPGWRR
jgi:hypothetical protein